MKHANAKDGARDAREAQDGTGLVGRLPAGALDIVGDVHGEWQALQALLAHLGYDAQGRHPEGRTLVFVGDLCDRGPDTPAVLDWFCQAWEAGIVHAVMGNHELNLIREDPKDGSGWFFEVRTERDRAKYAPFVVASPRQRERYAKVCNRLPLALEREDLRIVHAAWQAAQIDVARTLAPGSTRRHYDAYEEEAAERARSSDLQRRLQQEKADWPHDLEDGQHVPPVLRAHGERELVKQDANPLKVLVTGVESAADVPFYAGGKWRFTERMAWWNRYDEPTPVVIGHYWRQFVDVQGAAETQGQNTPHKAPQNTPQSAPQKAQGDGLSDRRAEGELFRGVPGNGWHGLHKNVFCLDFSVGARWSERLQDIPAEQSRFHLAALRWPERTLVLDSGAVYPTVV